MIDHPMTMQAILAAPGTPAEFAEAIRSLPRVLVVGAGTKPRLAAVEAPKLSTSRLSGIVEYVPSEFTFTALAGTSLREIAETLAGRGQYLPFDPMLLEAGATLGGTVASGLSGPGRFRFGGLRDFILGVRFVDGAGRILRMGGKVVKNAAGFDLPKFFVGSLGRFGALVELTFKVFPRPPANRTLRLILDRTEDSATVFAAAGNSRWEPDALDRLPDGRTILARFAAPPPALDAISREVLARWPGHVMAEDEAAAAWSDLAEFRWARGRGVLVKTAITPDQIASHPSAHISSGGNVAYSAFMSAAEVPRDLAGLTMRGDAVLWPGGRRKSLVETAVKLALDPPSRFPSLDE